MKLYRCNCGNEFKSYQGAVNCRHIKVRNVQRTFIQSLFNITPKPISKTKPTKYYFHKPTTNGFS